MTCLGAGYLARSAFLLTRRTTLLVKPPSGLPAATFDARSALRGRDELGRLEPGFRCHGYPDLRTQNPVENDIEGTRPYATGTGGQRGSVSPMFNASIDGLMLWSADGVLVDINPAFMADVWGTRAKILSLWRPVNSSTTSKR